MGSPLGELTMTVKQNSQPVKHVFALYDSMGIWMGHAVGHNHDDAADQFQRLNSSMPRPSLVEQVR